MVEVARVALAYAGGDRLAHRRGDGAGIGWQALTESDGRLTLDTVEWAHGAGIIEDEGARKLLAIRNADLTRAN